MLWTERRRVAALSLLATYLFFIEYVPPFKRVHFPYDIQGFHYPLLHYAFQSIREGRFPEWDPTIYCGLSFVGNLQAALFYPPNWLLLAANLGCRRLSYKSLEVPGHRALLAGLLSVLRVAAGKAPGAIAERPGRGRLCL